MSVAQMNHFADEKWWPTNMFAQLFSLSLSHCLLFYQQSMDVSHNKIPFEISVENFIFVFGFCIRGLRPWPKSLNETFKLNHILIGAIFWYFFHFSGVSCKRRNVYNVDCPYTIHRLSSQSVTKKWTKQHRPI